MSKSTWSLEELRARAAERRGGDKLTIHVGGTPYTIPAPGFWDDALKEAAAKVKETGDLPFVRKLMGAKEYDKFAAAGGRADDLILLIEEFKRSQGVDDLGESTPSSTS